MMRAVPLLSVLLLLACHFSTLRGMFHQWSTDEDMSHGFVVPVVVLWIVWRERDRWRTLPAHPSWWGMAILALAASLHFAAVLSGILFASSLAFLLSVAGLILCLGGAAYLSTWTFPLLLSLFMLPRLSVVYSQLTFPLQLLASRIAAALLSVAGVSVLQEGNVLNVAGNRLAVEEACSGIRYLLSLGFVGVVFAYMSDPKPWMRVALLVVAVPVAILGNAMRVAAIGVLPALNAGIAHTLTGFFVFLFCMAALVAVRGLLNGLVADRHV